MIYKFYIKMDEKAYGPYTLDEYHALDVPDDTEVMESSVGEWYLAKDYPSYEELKAMENFGGPVVPPLPPSLPPVQDEQPKTGWNWGAFGFSWLWGIFNGVYWPLIIIPCAFMPLLFDSPTFFYISSSIRLAIVIALGIYGNKWAWESKSWESAAKFNKVQKNWSKAFLYFLIISVGIAILISFLSVFVLYKAIR